MAKVLEMYTLLSCPSINIIVIKKKIDTNLLLYTKLVTKIPSRIVGPHKRKRPQGSFVLPLWKKELVFGRA